MAQYRDASSGQLFDKNGLLEWYIHELDEDPVRLESVSFVDWMQSMLQSGSIEEVRRISPYEAAAIKKAAAEFRAAFWALREAFGSAEVSEESFNNALSGNYPFIMSFDEVGIEDWVSDIIRNADSLEK